MIAYRDGTENVFSQVRESGDRIATDRKGGPCSREIEKHSPTSRGQRIRNEEGYNLSPQATINKYLHKSLMDVLKSAENRVRISHDGEPEGSLREALMGVINEEGLEEFWQKDRKWISLAQEAKRETDDSVHIRSSDGGFDDVSGTVEEFNIEVTYRPPGDY